MILIISIIILLTNKAISDNVKLTKAITEHANYVESLYNAEFGA